jgi:hypothetical protein
MCQYYIDANNDSDNRGDRDRSSNKFTARSNGELGIEYDNDKWYTDDIGGLYLQYSVNGRLWQCKRQRDDNGNDIQYGGQCIIYADGMYQYGIDKYYDNDDDSYGHRGGDGFTSGGNGELGIEYDNDKWGTDGIGGLYLQYTVNGRLR